MAISVSIFSRVLNDFLVKDDEESRDLSVGFVKSTAAGAAATVRMCVCMSERYRETREKSLNMDFAPHESAAAQSVAGVLVRSQVSSVVPCLPVASHHNLL